MTKITLDDLKVWRNNSITLARDLDLFEEPVLDRLEEVRLGVGNRQRPNPCSYGYVIYPEDVRRLFVYRRSLLRAFPTPLRDVVHQSGLDHELIGHFGSFFSNKNYHNLEYSIQEEIAFDIQERMARERGKQSLTWWAMSKFLPYIKKLQRGTDLSEYFENLTKKIRESK